MDITTNQLIGSVANVIRNARQRVFRMANSALLETYWQIGYLIVEDEQAGNAKAQYGKATLKKLSEALSMEFGKGFDERNLNNMRAFYSSFPIWNALRTELSWTHYRLLSRLDSGLKRNYYLQESVAGNWNSRELQRQINALAFERVVKHLPEHTSNPTIESLIKDPYIFEFLGLSPDEKNTERSIETALIDHLQKFLLEIGKGFAFVARQQHIVTDTSDFFIDLVFYNYMLKCFIVIDLKKGAMTHQDIGQLDMYVRMYDDLKRGEEDNPTIGILLCSEKDETIVKYSVLNDQNNLFANKYLLYLPKDEDLKKLIEEDRFRFDQENYEN